MGVCFLFRWVEDMVHVLFSAGHWCGFGGVCSVVRGLLEWVGGGWFVLLVCVLGSLAVFFLWGRGCLIGGFFFFFFWLHDCVVDMLNEFLYAVVICVL